MSAALSLRVHDLLRRVGAIYAAILHQDGEVVAYAGDASLGPRLVPLALALLEGGATVCGGQPFEHACLSGPTRVVNVHRIDAKHLLCVVMEPRSASAQLFIRGEVAALRSAALPEHERVQRLGPGS